MQAASIFKALSDETRLSIVVFLAKKKKASCKQLSEKFPDLSQPTMSHHFKVLAETGLLLCEKSGTENTYILNIKLFQKVGLDEKVLSKVCK